MERRREKSSKEPCKKHSRLPSPQLMIFMRGECFALLVNNDCPVTVLAKAKDTVLVTDEGNGVTARLATMHV